MSGYLGTKAVLLSTTSATVGGDSSVGGDSTIGGDLTVDTNTLYVDSTNNRVGIGNASPSNPLQVGTSDLIVDSSGNVGIGVTPASGVRLDVRNNSTTTLADMRNANSSGYGIYIAAGSSSSQYVQRWADYNNNALATIDSSGNLLVGTTGDLGGQISSLGNGRDALVSQVTSNSNSPYLGKNSSGSVIYIVSGLGTIYAVNTSVQSVSDIRTKENITDAEDGLSVVMGLKPRRFDFKEGFGGDRKNVLGFIAQEIETVFPDAVDTMPDGVMPNSTDGPYKSVGPAALIPVLVKAIQEQQSIIADLKARVTALEAE